MGTMKIREALLSRGATHDVSEALAEVEAIGRAMAILSTCSIDAPPHMTVEDFTPVIVTIGSIAKEQTK